MRFSRPWVLCYYIFSLSLMHFKAIYRLTTCFFFFFNNYSPKLFSELQTYSHFILALMELERLSQGSQFSPPVPGCLPTLLLEHPQGSSSYKPGIHPQLFFSNPSITLPLPPVLNPNCYSSCSCICIYIQYTYKCFHSFHVSLLVPHSVSQWFSKYYQHSTGTPSKDKYLGLLALPDVLNQNPWEWAQQMCFYKPSKWVPLHTEVDNPFTKPPYFSSTTAVSSSLVFLLPCWPFTIQHLLSRQSKTLFLILSQALLFLIFCHGL